MRARILVGSTAIAISLLGADWKDVTGTEAPVGAGASAPWAVPPDGSCNPQGGLRGWPIGTDAPPVPFQPGDVFDVEQIEILRAFIPPALWEHREKFFFEGMRLEIGACFRDYSPPPFFQTATEQFRGRAKLLDNDGLEDFIAGLPFHPDDIAPGDPRAGTRFAWNVAHRYQAGGLYGKFRITDMVGRTGRAEPFEGEIFKALLSHRADRADDRFQVPFSKKKHWVAGGKFFKPFAAREHAWRQYRHTEHETDPDRSDDLHAYLPEWRRVQRINASNVEGLYMPSFSVGVVQATTLGVGVGGGASGGSIAGAVSAADTLTTKRSGFEGLEIRPLLYNHRLLGVQDVLAPLNASRPGYPEVRERDFGPWGLSFASARWDLRRALVLEAARKREGGSGQIQRVVHYVDLQTFQPLYYMSYDDRDEAMDVGLYVGRWSEDREAYLRWPDDPERPVRVIDSVGAAFANLTETGGWRRESWEITSIPPPDRALKRLISVSNLTRGR